MITSKPKSTALVSLGIFIIICFAIGGYAFRAILNGVGVWYHYLFASFLILAIVLLLRQLLTYKIVKIGKKVAIAYPFRGSKKELKFKDMLSWKETIIKTKNDPFKQLELKFDGFLLKLSIQEHSNYLKIINFLKKRALKKELK